MGFFLICRENHFIIVKYLDFDKINLPARLKKKKIGNFLAVEVAKFNPSLSFLLTSWDLPGDKLVAGKNQ